MACENLKNAMKVCEPKLVRLTIKTIFPKDNDSDSVRWLNMFVARNRKFMVNPRLRNGELTFFTEDWETLRPKYLDFNAQCNNMYTVWG